MDAIHKSHLPKPVYGDSPTYQMAVLQLLTVAEHINLDINILERLSKPKRALIVGVPTRMDDGRTHTFIGYRCPDYGHGIERRENDWPVRLRCAELLVCGSAQRRRIRI